MTPPLFLARKMAVHPQPGLAASADRNSSTKQIMVGSDMAEMVGPRDSAAMP